MAATRLTVCAAAAAIAATAIVAAQARPPARYSVTIDGVVHTSASAPSFQVAGGSAQGVQPAADLLGFVPDKPNTGAAASSQPGPGLHQAINDLDQDGPITLLISAAAEIPGSGGKLSVVNLIVQGVSKAALAKLPLFARIRPIGMAAPAGPSALARASHDGTPYEGANGQVVIERIDFAARSIRGRFTLNTGAGLADDKPPLQMTAGRFEK